MHLLNLTFSCKMDASLCHDIWHKPRLYRVRNIFGSHIKWHVGSKRSTVGFPAGVTYRNTISAGVTRPNFHSKRCASPNNFTTGLALYEAWVLLRSCNHNGSCLDRRSHFCIWGSLWIGERYMRTDYRVSQNSQKEAVLQLTSRLVLVTHGIVHEEDE